MNSALPWRLRYAPYSKMGEHIMMPRLIRRCVAKIKRLPKVDMLGLVVIGIAVVAAPTVAFAQTDEIQVYDA